MSTSPTLTRRHVLGTTLIALAVAALPRLAWAQASTDQASAFIAKTSQDLTAVVNGAGTNATKAAALQAIIDKSVDVTSVGRFCLGRFWRVATPAQQKDYIDLFHRVLVQNITGKVGDYQGVTITVDRAAPREDGVAVTTTVTRPNSAPNRVDWLVSTESGAPRIIDVIAEGTSLRLEAGEREYLPITSGQRISFLEAADAPFSSGSSGGSGAAASAAFTSRSTTSVANASTALMPANAARQAMKIQAPAGADLWVNELGGTAAANGADCFSIPAGALYEPRVAGRAAVTYFCVAAGLPIVASEA